MSIFWPIRVLRFVPLFFILAVLIGAIAYPGGNIHDLQRAFLFCFTFALLTCSTNQFDLKSLNPFKNSCIDKQVYQAEVSARYGLNNLIFTAAVIVNVAASFLQAVRAALKGNPRVLPLKHEAVGRPVAIHPWYGPNAEFQRASFELRGRCV